MNGSHFAPGRQRVAVEALTVLASIGISDWERTPGKRQRLQFDVAVYRDAFGAETDIADCYNYSGLQRFLVGFGERPHIDLLETIVAEILDFCFQDARVAAVEATATKPDVFNGVGQPSVGAAVTRSQWTARRTGATAAASA